MSSIAPRGGECRLLFGKSADRPRQNRPTGRGRYSSRRQNRRADWAYKILEKIGEGGCGIVYLAEQLEPVRRRVALKIIKVGSDTRAVVARLEAERQALALMDHPHIAKVLDGGATPLGRA